MNQISPRYGIFNIQVLFMDNVYSMHFLKPSYLEETWFKTSEFLYAEGQDLNSYGSKDENSTMSQIHVRKLPLLKKTG